MSFTHDDVQRIIQLLNTSHFDELHLEADGIKLDLRRNGAGRGTAAGGGVAPATPQTSNPASAPVASASSTATASAVSANTAPSATLDAKASEPTSAGALLEVRAPMLGVFYRAPKPGADPFVSPGSVVQPDTVIGIIEVMKLMNSVPANLSGEVVEVLAKDGDLVEYDQVLMRIRASQA